MMLLIPLLLLLPSLLSAQQIPEIIMHPKRTESSLHLPIYRCQGEPLDVHTTRMMILLVIQMIDDQLGDTLFS
jgi:hypothetical protein